MTSAAPDFAVVSIWSSRPVIYHRARSSGASVIIALIVAIFVGRSQTEALIAVPHERVDEVLNSAHAEMLRLDRFVVERLYVSGEKPPAPKMTLRDVWRIIRYGDERADRP